MNSNIDDPGGSVLNEKDQAQVTDTLPEPLHKVSKTVKLIKLEHRMMVVMME